MNRTVNKEPIKYSIKQTIERRERIKLIGNPLDELGEKPIIQEPFVVLKPFGEQKTSGSTIHPTAENFIVCAWLTCCLCGYQTEDTTDFEVHAQLHKNEMNDDIPIILDDVKTEIEEDCLEDFEDDKEFYEPEKQTEILLPGPIPLNLKDPVGINGILRLMQHEKQDGNEQNGDIIGQNEPIDIFNNKPYTCNWCNHRTSTLKKLDEHMRIHTGERPFLCKTCGYATRNASALSYHLKTHKENRPYMCNLCNYRNTTLSSLRSHKTRIHLRQPSTSVQFQPK